MNLMRADLQIQIAPWWGLLIPIAISNRQRQCSESNVKTAEEQVGQLNPNANLETAKWRIDLTPRQLQKYHATQKLRNRFRPSFSVA